MSWKDKIPEVVIGGVLVAGAGWLINQTYVINRGLGSLDAKVEAKFSEHSGRIDRIATALPDVRIRIAKEELSKPVESAVVVLDPVKTSKGKWVTGFHVMDASTNTRSTYWVSVKGPQDREIAWLASGAVLEADPDALSFKTLATFSSDIGTPTPLPSYVQSQNSYVLRKPSANYAKALAEVLRGRSATEQTATVPAGVNTWEKLAAELTKNRDQYMVKSKP